MRVSPAGAVFLAAISMLSLSSRARAQDHAVPRLEAGPDLSFFQLAYWPTDAGGGAHVTVGLTPLISSETRMRLFGHEPIPALERGGRTFQIFSGARATFLSRGPATVYGVLMPGVIHFSNAVTSVTRDAMSVGGSTHFAVDMGAGVSIRLHDRWSLQADWTGPLYAVDGFSELSTFPPAAQRGIREVLEPAAIHSSAQFSAGVSYRTGVLAAPIEPLRRGSWLAGGDVGIAAYAPVVAVFADVIKAARVGGFTSFPLTSWMDADIGGDVYLHVDNSHATNEGGRISQLLAGAKVGRRSGRLGYFGKIRAGVQSHSQALLAAADYSGPPPYPPPVDGRRFRPALDIGTVIETSLGRRFVWRVDVSDVIAFYPSKTVLIAGRPVADYAMPAADQIVMTSGLAWRF